MASSTLTALTELRDAAARAVNGPVTVFPPSRQTVAGEFGWVEPDAHDMSGVGPLLASRGTVQFRVAVRVPYIDLQDKQARLLELLDPNETGSVQQTIWAQCGGQIRFSALSWGADRDLLDERGFVQLYGANLTGTFLLTAPGV